VIVELLSQQIHVDVMRRRIIRVLARVVLAVCRTRAQQKVVGQIVVQPNDGIVRQEGKLLSIRMIAHVPSAILKVAIEIKVAVEIRHRLLQVIHDVTNVVGIILIASSAGTGIVQLIVEELVVARAGSRVRHAELPKSAVDVGVVGVAACDFHVTRAATHVLLVWQPIVHQRLVVSVRKESVLKVKS